MWQIGCCKNHNDHAKNLYASMVYLNRFFENLLFGANHVLKNRELHVSFIALVNDTDKLGVKLNKNQQKMLELIGSNNKITIAEMAKHLSISDTAIENNIKKLKEKGILYRVGSDKTGHWYLPYELTGANVIGANKESGVHHPG